MDIILKIKKKIDISLRLYSEYDATGPPLKSLLVLIVSSMKQHVVLFLVNIYLSEYIKTVITHWTRSWTPSTTLFVNFASFNLKRKYFSSRYVKFLQRCNEHQNSTQCSVSIVGHLEDKSASSTTKQLFSLRAWKKKNSPVTIRAFKWQLCRHESHKTEFTSNKCHNKKCRPLFTPDIQIRIDPSCSELLSSKPSKEKITCESNHQTEEIMRWSRGIRKVKKRCQIWAALIYYFHP